MRAFWLLIKSVLKFNAFTNSSPNDGEIWYDGTKLKKKQGGTVSDLDTAGTGAVLYTQGQGLTTLQKYYARENIEVPIITAKIQAPDGTDTSTLSAGDVVGGYTLQLNDVVFCQSTLAEESGCFIVGSTDSTLVTQVSLVQIKIGTSGGKLYSYNQVTGYQEVAGGGGGGNTYIQQTDPAPGGDYIWFKTDSNGKVIDILKG